MPQSDRTLDELVDDVVDAAYCDGDANREIRGAGVDKAHDAVLTFTGEIAVSLRDVAFTLMRCDLTPERRALLAETLERHAAALDGKERGR
jgi:hypothetical protein